MEGVEAWRDCGDDGVMGSLVSVYSFSRCAPTTRPVHFIIQYSLLLPPHTTTILTHRLATHLVPSFASRVECVWRRQQYIMHIHPPCLLSTYIHPLCHLSTYASMMLSPPVCRLCLKEQRLPYRAVIAYRPPRDGLEHAGGKAAALCAARRVPKSVCVLGRIKKIEKTDRTNE